MKSNGKAVFGLDVKLPGMLDRRGRPCPDFRRQGEEL